MDLADSSYRSQSPSCSSPPSSNVRPVKLAPFNSVDGVAFSISPEQLVAQLGQPMSKGRNEVGLNEFDYGAEVYRFQDSGRLEEITKCASVVHNGELAVPFGSLQRFIKKQDHSAFERSPISDRGARLWV